MDDLISRQEAIEAAMNDDLIVNAMDSVKDGDMHRTKRAIARLLTSLPSAQPARKKGEWIPVSERLPKDEVDVLVTDDSGGYATIGIDCMCTKLDTGERYWLASQRVTAWMPLPEPYKEDKNDATIH